MAASSLAVRTLVRVLTVAVVSVLVFGQVTNSIPVETVEIKVSPKLTWQQGLIPLIVPILIRGVRYIAPQIMPLMLPLMSPVIGVVIDWVFQLMGFAPPGGAAVGAALGAAGVMVREGTNQTLKAAGVIKKDDEEPPCSPAGTGDSDKGTR